MSEEPKIERCPFCPSEEVALVADSSLVYVKCVICNANGNVFAGEHENIATAIEHWNAASEPARLLEELFDRNGRLDIDDNYCEVLIFDKMESGSTPLEALRNAFKDE